MLIYYQLNIKMAVCFTDKNIHADYIFLNLNKNIDFYIYL